MKGIIGHITCLRVYPNLKYAFKEFNKRIKNNVNIQPVYLPMYSLRYTTNKKNKTMLNIESSILLVAFPENMLGSGIKYINLKSNKKNRIKKNFACDNFIFITTDHFPSTGYLQSSSYIENMP